MGGYRHTFPFIEAIEEIIGLPRSTIRSSMHGF
jgi:hypothetical protein